MSEHGGDAAPGELVRSLGTFRLWGIAVGLVVSGEYFGWASAGTLGFLVTTILVTIFYASFVLSFTELSTAIPRAGGPFAYATRALGPYFGFLAGISTLVEFVFAPPAIALSLGAYLHVQSPALDPKWVAVAAYVIFMGLNVLGVTIAATFELVVTLLAIFELCLFLALVLPSFSWEKFSAGGFGGADEFSLAAAPGILGALPFAMWFFLAIEGAAMAAEEAREPSRTIPRAFLTGIATLVVLAFGVMFAVGGVGDWRALTRVDDPLPRALEVVVGSSSRLLSLLVWIGSFGLVASFHGIILGYSRQIFALSRAGELPRVFGELHPRTRTPHVAILVGGVVGLGASFADSWFSWEGRSLTATLVSLSVFGALGLYVLSLVSLFVLRRREPDLARPFRAPLYPWLPALSLVLALGFFVAMASLLPALAATFAGILALASIGYWGRHRRARN